MARARIIEHAWASAASERLDLVKHPAGGPHMRREWCDSLPEHLGDAARPRFARLYDLLRSEKMEVRVLPDDVFGLIHSKAGVITLANDHRTAFLGSANESKTALRLNYELVWEDDTPETVEWVQEEFDALWTSPFAVQLADFVVEDPRHERRLLVTTALGSDETDPIARPVNIVEAQMTHFA